MHSLRSFIAAAPAAVLGVCLVTVVCSLGCASDTAASGSAPSAMASSGLWQGEELSFTVDGPTLKDLVLTKQTCTGDGCSAEVGGAVAGSFTIGQSIDISVGTKTITGTFDTANTVSGKLDLTSQDGCCRVIGAWSAKWVEGLRGTSSGGTSSGGGSSGGANWGGHSTGNIHPGPALAPPQHQENGNLSATQNDALKQLNALRAEVGATPVKQDEALAKAAQGHADFYVKHVSAYKAAKLNPHKQDAKFGAGFTGTNLGDRIKKAGYKGPPGAEVMAFTGSVSGALAGWMATVYHRLPLIDPRTALMGFGKASSAKARCEVMDTGRGSPKNKAIIVYPVPGQTGVPRSWSGNEGPQPPKPKSGYPSGPVITARFPGAFTVVDHKLLTSDGKPLAHVWLTKDNDKVLKSFDAQTVVIYADTPLAGGTYTVRIDAKVDGANKTLAWRFTTK